MDFADGALIAIQSGRIQCKSMTMDTLCDALGAYDVVMAEWGWNGRFPSDGI